MDPLFSPGAAWVSYAPSIGAIIAFSMYTPLYMRIRAGSARQNVATFVLWGFLDAIAAGSIFLEGGNYLLPLLYTFGCIAIIHAIVRTGTWQWTWRETLASVFVGASVVVWVFMSNELATIVSTLGVVAAGVPQLIDNWEDPSTAPIDLYVGFTIGNALSLVSLVAGDTFSVEEHFYGASCSVLTFLFVLVALRKWLPRNRSHPA